VREIERDDLHKYVKIDYMDFDYIYINRCYYIV
jgi:hypothetical protein